MNNLVEKYLREGNLDDDRIYLTVHTSSKADACRQLYYYMMETENMVPEDFDFFTGSDDYIPDQEPSDFEFKAWYFEQERSGLVNIEKDPNSHNKYFIHFLKD